MIKVYEMTHGHRYWDEVIEFAEKCSWKAGPFLAEQMRTNRFSDFERVFAVCDNENIMGFCTFTEKDELSEEYDFSPFIGFMFIDEAYRGNRLSEKLIQYVEKYADRCGFDKIYIMSGEIGLYEKYGFQKMGDYKTIYDTMDQLFVKNIKTSN